MLGLYFRKRLAPTKKKKMNIKTLFFGLLVLQFLFIVIPSSNGEIKLKTKVREKRCIMSYDFIKSSNGKVKEALKYISIGIKGFFERFTTKHHAEVEIGKIYKKHIEISVNRSKLMKKAEPYIVTMLRKKRTVAPAVSEITNQTTQISNKNITDIQTTDKRAIRNRRAIPAIAIFAAKLIAWSTATAAVGVGVVMYDRSTMETVLNKRVQFDCKTNNYGCLMNICYRNCGPRAYAADWCLAGSISKNTTTNVKTIYLMTCDDPTDCDPCLSCVSSCMLDDIHYTGENILGMIDRIMENGGIKILKGDDDGDD